MDNYIISKVKVGKK